MPELHLPAEALSTRETYRLMTSIVTPRPIAWVSTVSAQGVGNLAPFSYFQAVCSAPPTVVLGLGTRGDGSPKDTLRNVLDTQEFTISHVSAADAEAMNLSSANYDVEVDEAEQLGVELVPGSGAVRPGRVASAAAAMECRMVHALPLGEGPGGKPSSMLIVGRVVGFWVREGLLLRDERGRISGVDADGLDGVGRMGGVGYTHTRERFELDRPGTPVVDGKTEPSR